MPIAVLCAACDAKLNAPDTAAGKKVKCPKCGQLLILPMPSDDFEVVEDEPEQQVIRKPAVAEDEAEDEPIPVRKKKPVVQDDDEETEDKPRPKKKRKNKSAPKSNSLPLVIGGGVLGLALVGFLVYWFAIRTPEVAMGPNTNSPGNPTAPVVPPGPQVPGSPQPQPQPQPRPQPQPQPQPKSPNTTPAGWKLHQFPEFSAWFADRGQPDNTCFDRLPLPKPFPYTFGTRFVRHSGGRPSETQPLSVLVVPLKPEQKAMATTNLGELFKTIFGAQLYDDPVPNIVFKEAKLDGKPAVEWSDVQRKRTLHYLGAVAHDRAYLLIAGSKNATPNDELVTTFRRGFRFGINVPKPPEMPATK